ncbi:hypothetical protein [Devosia sp.]|uniref:hypothetical protein n=1 Tax=Devosia sp. TaxID=1871048 RepID=UPI003BAD13E1
MSSAHAWQWPDTGPTPVSYGLDTEIYDSEKFPHAETFVREAIQNSLDARADKKQPVHVRFGFFDGPLGPRAAFLADLQAHKHSCGLSWPEEWAEGRMSWLLVEDSNTSGLKGSLTSRISDFWNYWLNFGISNKTGAGRGGRGIGRVTFLIASGISTVIGITRRADGSVAACGMSVLKPVMEGEAFKSSFAYLAKPPAGSIYPLYDDPKFLQALIESFKVTDYRPSGKSGLSLIVPYPHQSLTPDRLIAAAIAHFAPAIISGSLALEVNGQVVDHSSIDVQAQRVAAEFPPGPMREDAVRLLALIRHSSQPPHLVIAVAGMNLEKSLTQEAHEKLRADFQQADRLCLAIDIPVTRNGKTTTSRLHAAIGHTPMARRPADLFFREGMCLPEVSARNSADVDLAIQSDDGEIVSYLNFCEGKAHLGLMENKEVREKLIENGFGDNVTIKRFVRNLMDTLRALVLPDATKPDASVFSTFFSLPKLDGVTKKGQGGVKGPKGNPPPPPTPPVVPKQPTIFIVDELPDGFRVRANKEQANWPANLWAQVAYSDGSRSPAWSEFDFDLNKLPTEQQGAAGKTTITKNVLIVRDCGSDFQMEIRGFDARRELITNVKGFRNA